MSDSKSHPRRASVPTPALQALSDAATGPVRRALRLDALEQQLRPCLPPALALHCRLANVSNGKLVFLVDSPVWRAKLRLAAPEILNLAQSLGLAVTEVTAKVSTLPAAPIPSTPPKVLPATAAASRDALQAAFACLDDSGSPEPDRRPSRRR